MHENQRRRQEMLARTVDPSTFEPIVFTEDGGEYGLELPPIPGGWAICHDRTGAIYKIYPAEPQEGKAWRHSGSNERKR